jgi:hypothetical protein
MPRQQYSERSGAAAQLERPMLIWRRGDRKAGEYVLWPERPVTVGRDATNTIHIDSPYISKNHAVLAFRNGDWTLEDLNSANGTRVNGNPIRVHFGLRPGDQIEIGDDVLQFVDAAKEEAAKAAKGPGKWLRLGLAATAMSVVLVAILVPLIRSTSPPVTAGPAKPAAGPDPVPLPPGARVRIVDTALINQTLDRARRTGLSEADVLFDEGQLNLESGRYRDATQLFTAAQARRPNDAGISGRLSDAQRALEQSIAEAIAEAGQAGSELRYDTTRLALERVLAMTYPGDPRNVQAVDSLRKLEDARRKSGAR